MSTARMLTDVAVAAVLALLVLIPLNAVAFPLGTRFGVVIATMYYFSRNPWGSRDDDSINDRIDDLYEEYLPWDAT